MGGVYVSHQVVVEIGAMHLTPCLPIGAVGIKNSNGAIVDILLPG
jgi:hypothetical protein